MKISLKLPRPHEGQRRVLNSSARFRVLMCGRRWGKSLISQSISIDGILKGQRVAYITPIYKLAKKFYDDIVERLPDAVISSKNKADLKITLVTGGVLEFYTGENLDALRGSKFHMVIIDEAAYISNLKDGWLNSIRPTLADYRGKALFISTPRGKDYFNELFVRGNDDLYPTWESFHYSSYTNPYLHASEIDEAKTETPKMVFDQEYLAIPSANANSVLSQEDIESHCMKDLLSDRPTVSFGIDLSAGKNDPCVIVGLDELGYQTYFDRWLSLDFETTYSKIELLQPDIIKTVDATGLGQPMLYEMEKREIMNLNPITFTPKTKTSMVQKMIIDIEQGRLHYNQHIADELSIFEYRYTATGHITYGNKVGGSNHDDAVIALALANEGKPIYANMFDSFAFID